MKQIKIVPILLFAILIILLIDVYFNITISVKINRNQLTALHNQYTNSIALENFQKQGYKCIFTAPKTLVAASNTVIDNYIDTCMKDTPELK